MVTTGGQARGRECQIRLPHTNTSNNDAKKIIAPQDLWS